MPRPDPWCSRPQCQDHGGNWREVQRLFGLERLVDFSASINPRGHPPGLQEHLLARWGELAHYPDRACRDLRASLSGHLGVSPECILVGNGSAELIDLLFRSGTFRRVVLCPPDFGLYRERSPASLPVLDVPREEREGFLPHLRDLRQQARKGDLVTFSNPGNPSGACVEPSEVVSLARHCHDIGAQLLVDEAFVDFCPEKTVLSGGAPAPGLIVLRSMTKFYGIPGLRLGYLVAHPETVERLAAEQLPWSVNALAQAAGGYCLAQSRWAAESIAFASAERCRLSAVFAALPGAQPLDSCANYLLIRLEPPAPSAGVLYHELIRKGFLARHCGSFGLGEGYLRFAVRTGTENADLGQALREIWSPKA